MPLNATSDARLATQAVSEPSRFALSAERDRYLENIHATLDVDATAYTIVNDGRSLLRCDRMSILESRRGGFRLRAVSGVDQLDRRGYVAQALEHLAAAVAKSREALYYAGHSAHLPPQLQTPLEEYVNQAHVRRLAVLPLPDIHAGTGDALDALVGVLVVEDFHARGEPEGLWSRIATVSPQITRAFANALTLERMPLMSVSRFLQSALGRCRRPGTWLVAVASMLVVSATFYCEVEHRVVAQGRVLPKLRRDVFAPADGVIREVHVTHGDRVKVDDVLAELWSAELDQELNHVVGDLQTAQQRLQAVRAQVWNDVDAANRNVREGQLAAQENQIIEQIHGLEAQRDVLQTRQAQLVVRAPIDGQIQTWNPEGYLKDRPVRRGQSLMTVADTTSHWTVELMVPDRDVGEILQAQQQWKPDLDVRFLLATQPEASYHGVVDQVAMAHQLDRQGRASLRVEVDVDAAAIPGARSGAEAVAKIQCGRRPLAYVWFHQLANFVRRHLFF